MVLLSLDTSSVNCAVHVRQGKDACFERSETIGRGHAEVVLAMIDEALGALDVAYRDLTRIGVTTGPGSFTGVRVGLSVARALALALDIPVIGISTLKAHAAGCPAQGAKLVALDARRGEFYTQLFDQDNGALAAPRLLSAKEPCPEEWLTQHNLCLIGSGAAHFQPILAGSTIGDESSAPAIATVAELCEKADVSPLKPVPLYLRPVDAKPQSEHARIARISS